MRTFASLALGSILMVFALIGCQEDFRPQSDLEGLEVLGIQASPPAIVFGETSTLSALVFSADEEPTYSWSVCLFDTGPYTGFECADPSLECCLGTEPTVELSLEAIGECNQDCLDLPETNEDASVPSDVLEVNSEEGLAALQELEQVRVRVLVAAGGARIEAVKAVELHSEGVRNTNPTLGKVEFTGEACGSEEPCEWKEDETLQLQEGAKIELTVEMTPGESEEEEDQLQDSSLAWYTHNGEMNAFVTRADIPENQLTVKQEEDRTSDTVTLWIVARDGNGGTAWISRVGEILPADAGETEE